jgi:hypothetical protein
MRQFATILFVLIFAMAGNSQVNNYTNTSAGYNLLFVSNENPPYQNPLFFENDFFDEQELNDLDCFDCVFIFYANSECFEHFKIKIVADVLPPLQIIQVGELHLDLPPPVLSA